MIRARSQQESKAKIALITTGADAYSSPISLSKEWKEIEISLTALSKDSYLLLPRPYPGFQPLRFTTGGNTPFNIHEIEKLEITFGEGYLSPVGIEIESVYLKK